MTAGNFARCLPIILSQEGGWADSPADPGGATMRGVTLETYSHFLGRQATRAELRLIPADAVSAIYRTGFWTPVRGDDLPAGVDLFCFDSAINCGPATATRWLQHALGVVEDGNMGVRTLRALADASDGLVIEDMRQQRELHYRALATFGSFGSGWLHRLSLIADTAQSWAARSTPPTTSADIGPDALMAAISHPKETIP